MPGKAQKSVSQLQQQSNPRAQRGLLVLVPDPHRKVPTAPKGLTSEAKAIWRDFWRSPLSQAVDYGSDGPALRRWIWCVSERDRLLTELYAPPVAGESGNHLMVRGSMGQEVLNPLLRYEERLSREIMAYEERFGMTPLARMRLGIAFGQAADSLAGMRQRLDPAPKSDDGIIDLGELG